MLVDVIFQMRISILDDDDDDDDGGGGGGDDDPQWAHIPAFAQDDVDFLSCLSTINGESIRTLWMVFAWKLSQEFTKSPGAQKKTDMQTPIAGPRHHLRA